jgi:hypothetical protein
LFVITRWCLLDPSAVVSPGCEQPNKHSIKDNSKKLKIKIADFLFIITPFLGIWLTARVYPPNKIPYLLLSATNAPGYVHLL